MYFAIIFLKLRRDVLRPSSGFQEEAKQANCKIYLALTSCWWCAWFNEKMDAIRSSETSAKFYQTSRPHIPEDGTLPFHGCENLKLKYMWRIESVVSRNKVCDDIGKVYPLQLLGSYTLKGGAAMIF